MYYFIHCIIPAHPNNVYKEENKQQIQNYGVRYLFGCVYIQNPSSEMSDHKETVFTWISPFLAAAAAKSLQSCPTLCDPIDSSPPGSLVPGILQARTLEWVAISFSNAGKWKVKVKSLSRVRLLVTPWTAAHQAPPSMGFSRQEYWSGEPFLSPGDLPNPGIEPRFPAMKADSLPSEPPGNEIGDNLLGILFSNNLV